jgi:hypothetical protein
MMKILWATVLIVMSATTASAGTIAITVTAGTGVCAGGCTKSFTDTDANLAKIVPAYQAQCNISISLAGPPLVCTPAQVVTYYFQWVINRTMDFVNTAQNNAALAATVLPTPINPQ